MWIKVQSGNLNNIKYLIFQFVKIDNRLMHVHNRQPAHKMLIMHLIRLYLQINNDLEVCEIRLNILYEYWHIEQDILS